MDCLTLPSENRRGHWLPVPPFGPAIPVTPQNAGATECWLVEFRVGSRSLPYLADHGFHDMVVLPGSFYIGLVRFVHQELFRQPAVQLRDIDFENPVMLAEHEAAITVRAEKLESGRIAYALFEATTDETRDSQTLRPCARLQVEIEPTTSVSTSIPVDLNESSALGAAHASAADFYRQLRRNGNQYGPCFQTLTDISHSRSQATAKWAETETGDADFLCPPQLDAGPQLLSAFNLERGRTFILKSIGLLTVHVLEGAAPRWIRAVRTDQNRIGDTELVGAVQAVDASGTCLWELSDVSLAFIDAPMPEKSVSAEVLRLGVTSTFTAEPLEESLQFWGGHFGRNVQVDFAPYGQVFQQLLDPTSAFRQNRDGINLVVLGLEDWLIGNQNTLRPADPARTAACFGERPTTLLPNGLEIVHLNSYETDYVYQEIFEDQSYLRHDIQLADGDTVIDIGANIGLFSLFVMSRCKNPTIYAYEPSPRVFDLLKANFAAYGDPTRVHALNCGVSQRKGTARFTCYEKSSVFSSFHPDEQADRAAIEAVVRNVLNRELPDADGAREADIRDLTASRLRAETIDCPLTPVSEIIRENGLTRIHLLKIDAEKSEMEILDGIEEAQWPLIDQIVMEIHDSTQAAVRSIESKLTHHGFRCAVIEEKLLTDSGLFNIYATRRAPAASTLTAATDGLSRKVEEFCGALDAFAGAVRAPLVLAVAPRSSEPAVAAHRMALDAAEDRLLARAAAHPQIRSIASQTILARYPLSQWHDPHSHQLGHMPFTPAGYAALGTALFRTVFQFGAPPVKVIALDCDNTLWQGLCGEDGPGGVSVTAPFRRLQEFMVDQVRSGILVVLCSKNHEDDVLAVFERHPDMPLRREHLAGWRINWERKSENLRALAAQLNLGLDSFVFIDDNPVECAATRAECPEAIVLQLPAQSDRIPAFLESLWLFDREATTAEDRERNHWYRANAAREEERAAAPTLRDFLDGLELRIVVAEATSEQLGRVSQLTMRTNQFNLHPIRRSEGEIRDLISAGATCLVTSVSDRFGDSGLVGAILYTSKKDRFSVDTFLLSCRALGKGVEHRMLAELAQRAIREGKPIIELPYRPTDRNQPAWEFIEQLAPAGSVPPGGELELELSSATVAQLHYAPEDRIAKNGRHESTTREANTSGPRSAFGRMNLREAMQRLGDEFHNIEAIVVAMESSRQQAQPASSQSEAEPMGAGSAFERSLAEIWKKVLGRNSIGYSETFFDAGGTSLKAVVLVAMVRKELKRDVSIVTLFECPTIKLLAERLNGSPGPGASAAAATAGAESRGRQRRHKFVKRVSA